MDPFDPRNVGTITGSSGGVPTQSYTSNASDFLTGSFPSFGTVGINASSPYYQPGTVFNQSTGDPVTPFEVPSGTRTDAGGVSFDVSGQIDAEADIADQAIDYQQQYLDYVQDQMNQAYGATVRTAERQIGELESELPLVEQEIRQSFESAVPGIERARDERVSGLEQQERDLVKEGRKTEGAQRRLFNELMTAGGQYIGTSVGEAFGELMGRNFVSTIGNIRDTVVKGVNEARGEVGRVQEFYASELNNLQKQMETAVRRARTTFQNEINKIRDNIRSSEEQKANARQGALLEFQSAVNNIRGSQALRQQELLQWAQTRNASAKRAEDFYVRGLGGFMNTALQTAQLGQALGRELTPRSIENMWSAMQRGATDEELFAVGMNAAAPAYQQGDFTQGGQVAGTEFGLSPLAANFSQF